MSEYVASSPLEAALTRGYVDNGRTVNWGEDLGAECMEAMAQHEVFTLLGPDGEPYAKLLRDYYGTIREKRL